MGALLKMIDCKESECLNEAHSLGWCIKHYKNFYRHGNPSATFIRTRNGSSIQDKLLSKSKINSENGCLEWFGAVNSKGYGKLTINKKTIAAHRLSYQDHYKVDISGQLLMHICDNPKCINPKHLVMGTIKDNINDKVTKGRQLKGAQCHNARLNEDIVRDILSLHSNDIRNSVIARKYNIALSHVNNIVNRKIWKHVEISL